MKLLLILMVLCLGACSKTPSTETEVVISPLTRQLAACAIAATQISGWSANERIGRYQVNRGAAEQTLVEENPALSMTQAAAYIGVLVDDRSNDPVAPGPFYERNCV